MNKQTGGTLVGFILGLLVGLGVALGVAVYVTKVPVPFVDRAVQRKPDQDALEIERNKNWNPNATLTTKPAPAKVETPAAEATVPTPAPATAAVPARTAPVAAKSDALGDLIQSKVQGPGQVAKVEAQVADPFIYFVQAGAFRSPDEAEAQRAKLALGGFDAKVSEREQAGKAVFRVRLGPYNQKTEAEAMTDNLKNQGFDTALVRVQR